MNDFSDLIDPAAVKAGANASSKKQLFQLLSDLTARAYGLDHTEVLERLIERERLGSTGFGGGIAIPHAKIDGLERACGAMLLLDEPVPFEAVDEQPVDLVFVLLSPADSGADHLKMLARISRFLRSDRQVKRLRGASSDAALFALLTGGETRDAA